MKHLAQRYPATGDVAWFFVLLLMLLFVDYVATGFYGDLPGLGSLKRMSAHTWRFCSSYFSL
ncbi:hypothetical protein ACXZ1M_07575 [Duganella sp. PWIR1]